jgi:hypothetical protein
MSSMGMDKSGNTAITGSSTWTKVTVFTVRSGYPATVITNNALVVDVAGDYSITWRGSFVFDSGTQNFRVMLNGVTVLGTAVAANTIGTVASQTLAVGDTIELWAQTSAFSGTGTQVEGGAANTYVYITALSTPHTGQVTQTVGWNFTLVAAVNAQIAASLNLGWAISAGAQVNMPVEADPPGIGWAIEADAYQGIHYDAAVTQTIGWTVQAEAQLIPKVQPLPSVFAETDLAVSVHTVDGRAVGDFPCNLILNYSFGRESLEVSTAEIQVATQGDPDLIEELRQWVHWITLWLGDTPVWTGPIWHIRISRALTTIKARDPAIFMWRTRVPISRTFSDTVPARIANVMWTRMMELHNVRATPLVLPDLSDDTFTVTAQANTRMMHQFMDELVKVGLHWTVVSGRPVLGQFPRSPVAELQECDFLVEIERQRDGSQTFNDLRVQGQNWAATAIADLAGLHLQGMVSLDDMFGASNIERAAEQQARETARLRDDLVVPANASLHPQAPVTMDDLTPGKVFALYTSTASQLMRLDQLQVTGSQTAFDVQVTLVALEQDTDISIDTGG